MLHPFHLCRTMYLLGYIPKDDRLYLGDKELNIVSYCLLVSVLEYQTAVMRRDFGMADKVLPTTPKEQRTRVAHFLEKQVRKTKFKPFINGVFSVKKGENCAPACWCLSPLLSFQGFKQQALAVSTDPEHRFELALQLGELKIAYQIAIEAEVREFKPDFKVNLRSSKCFSHIALSNVCSRNRNGNS